MDLKKINKYQIYVTLMLTELKQGAIINFVSKQRHKYKANT